METRIHAPGPLPGSLALAAASAGLELQAALAAGPLGGEIPQRLEAWLRDGREGSMGYLRRSRHVLADLRAWKPWTRTVLLFSAPYPRTGGSFRGGGRVARYALGRDYHRVLGRRLEGLGRRLVERRQATRFRAVTDSAPVLEREWALRGGLGFRGKNTLVLDPALGPWMLLGELLVDSEWPESTPRPPVVSCGTCTRCLEECPTRAFDGPYLLDPRRCISYLTIEHRGPIPRELRARIGDWVFGCDACLEVCPFGRSATDRGDEWGRLPALDELALEDILALDRMAFAEAFRGSPLRRPGWAGLLRNACVVLGNLRRGSQELERAIRHPEPLVRGHAAWALGRLGQRDVLRRALPAEDDPWAREELEAALAGP